MRFTPYFALAGAADPYQGIEFAARHSVIRGRDGRIIFESDVVAPTGWSPLAVDMLAQKYARKAGVPAATVRVPEADVPEWLQRSVPAAGTPLGGETDARQLFNRLAGCWTYWGWTLGYFDDEASARAFYADHCRMLALQLAAPNSPQWFNTGLYWAYGIKGADRGHWAFDPATGEVLPSRRSYVRPGASACHIQSIADNLVEPGGILDFTTREARVFQQGSGSGANYSPLRGTGEPLSGGGKSSGLMSFLPAIDRFAGAIKSGGTVRRAARMVVLDLDHPDAEEFVDWKVRQEHKVACLVAGSRVCRDAVAAVHACRLAGDAAGVDQAAARAAELGVPAGLVDQAERLAAEGLPPPAVPEFDTGYTGEAYETVTGQNANNSVGATAAFMRAVAEDADWPLYWRTERAAARAEGRPARPCKTVKARSLWDRVARAAWACADPGVQFHTTMEDWNPVPGDGPIDASNPCSEYLFIKDTSCNLGCLNLLSLVDPADWTETVVRIREAVRLYTVALDVTVSAAGYPSERLATGARDYRTLGLGYANLGALLMRNGLAYDSDAARGWAVALTALVHFGATATSAELAAAVGPFPRYAANRAGVDRVVRNHLAYVTDRAYDGLSVAPPDPGVALAAAPAELVAAAVAAGHTAVGVVAAHGLRNAQLTLLMPAGTVGLLMDCDTTGVEPDFALVKSKHLADDGWVTIVNQSVGPALTRLGYTGPAHDAVTAHVREYGTVEGCTALAPEHLPVFDCANKCGRAGTRFIAVAGHIRMMAAVQPLLSGGISKCVTGDTVVPTDRGLIRIGDLYAGQAPDTFTPVGLAVPTAAGMTRAAEYYYGGTRPVWRVTLADGRTIRGTAPHRLRVATPLGLAWKEAPAIEPGDYVAIRRGTECWGSETVPVVALSPPHGSQHAFRQPAAAQAVDVALFLGMLTADGHVSRSNYVVGLTKNDPHVRATFTALLADLFGLTGREVEDQRNGVMGVTLGSKSLVEWLDAVGFSKERVPAFVLGGSRAMAVAYLSGLYLDGYFTAQGQGPSISQKHGSLLADVRAIWDNLGVATYETVNTVDGTDYPVLHASGHCRRTAADLLTWLEPHKAAAAAAVTNGRDERPFPLHRERITAAVRAAGRTHEFRTVLDPRTAALTRRTAVAAAEAVGVELTAEELALDYARVEAVEPAGDAPVYDLSVPGPEEFVGNGIVNHNTCNMPAESTVADVRAAYDLAWRLGVKCVALYRDGSKLSQPLSTQGRTVHARTESPRQLSRAERRHLPNRRAGHTQKFRIGGHKFYLKTGEYEDGTLGEVFLTCDKEGGFLQSVVSAVAKITSIALQYGVPLDEIVNAWLFSRFEPNGPVQGHNRIRNGLSVFDVIARHLAIEYLARADLAHTDVPTAVAAGGTAAAGVTEPRIYNGTPCPSCEMLKMRWDGKCTRCDNCGATTGCV